MKIKEDIITYPRTLRERIYIYLKNAILKGELKANQRIQEKEIASLFGVSTTPVREAILKLAGEGFIRIDSHKEAFVKEISYKELEDIYEVIRFLDGLCMRMVVETITEERIKEIEKLTEKMEKFCDTETIDEYCDLNSKIHIKIWESVDNKFLYKIILQVHDQFLRYNTQRLSVFNEPGALEESLKDHKLLVKILKERDKDKAEKFALRHWRARFLPPPF
jgi:DNA-binding GntR family transcriptional regulator